MPAPSPRAIGRALAVLQALPPPALAALAARLIDRLDALTPDADREPDDDDCCPAGDDDPANSRPCVDVGEIFWSCGDPADDEAEPHQEGPAWTPTKGPDGCGPLLLARVA